MTAMRALIVDDSRAMRSILGRIVTQLGFEVSQAGDGKQALTALTTATPPDLVLVDWNMPEMNGLELVRAVRADAALAKVVLIMVTTQSEGSNLQDAIDAGANEYVMKPFTPEILTDKLRLVGLV